ncbi:MAG TPA: DJ-1/PfpI family protein [Polyangiaceae bacterium]|nr:DJ-1/PfpI family protein [Polyangiaceae bacterium]
MPNTVHLVFALYPQLTQLDFTGPYEVLRRMPGARVSVASRSGGSLVSDSGLTFGDLKRLAEIESCDLICVPGGRGRVAAEADREFMEQLRRLAAGARYVTSVCTGSLLLGAAGLIRGKRAACHWAWRELLAEWGAIPDAGRVVRDGNVITGGGVTAGIDFALTVVAEIAGRETAQAIQLSLEYDPAPPFDAGRPEKAPRSVLAAVCARIANAYPERSALIAESA